MSHLPFAHRLAACFLCLLATMPMRALAIDLDELDPGELQAALDAELGDDDLRQYRIDPNKAYPIEVLVEAILGALSDAGDDANEQLITQAELEEEMEEVDTTLEAVVRDALEQIDSAALPAHKPFIAHKVSQQLAREDMLKPARPSAIQAKLAVRNTIVRAK